jgi:hypothetical protein
MNPQYPELATGETSPYCSDICQAAATAAIPQVQQGIASPLSLARSRLTISPAICSYPGCTQPAALYPVDHYWNYCGESHERQVLTSDLDNENSYYGIYSYARKGCISCRQADDNGTELCKRCKESFRRRAPTIIPVPMDHDAFWHGIGPLFIWK